MRRQLNLIESANLRFNRLFPNNFAMNAHVKGEITIPELRSAINKLCEKRPFLTAHVETADGVEWYDTEGSEPISVNMIERDWNEAIIEYLSIVFDSLKSPQLRFLLGNTDGYSDLVLIIGHGSADGLSAAYILRDILHYIAHPDEPVIPMENLPSLDELLPHYEIGEIPPPPDLSGGAAPSTPAESKQLFVHPWALSEAETKALLAKCREHQVTVHAALCTAFLNIFVGLDSSGRTLGTVSSPVSVRNRLTQAAGEQVGNYINSNIRVSLECSPTLDFWDMAQEFNKRFAEQINNDSLLIPIVTWHKILRSFYKIDMPFELPESDGMADYDLSISNLGNLNFPQKYGHLELECIYGPMLNSFTYETIIGVATVSNRLTFSLTSRLLLMSYSDAVNIREKFTVMLKEVLLA